MIIAVDFDGTCVKHAFPEVGEDIGAAPVLRKLVDSGHKLILYTMRDNKPDGRQYLSEAIEWFSNHGIPLWGINENPEQKSWTTSPKPFAHYYIDDMAIGCPLLGNQKIERQWADWKELDKMLSFLNKREEDYLYKE